MLHRALSFVVTLAAVSSGTQASELLWSNPTNGNSVTDPSMLVTGTVPPTDAEVADDFDVAGSIERLVVHGYECSSCGPPPVEGVNVRFYAWTPDGPGALQAEQFIAAGDGGFLYDAAGPAVLDITLPAPFDASGQHFVSVQMVFGSWGWWTWWFSSMNDPQGSAIWYRNAAEGGAWGPHVDLFGNVSNHDVGFDLYGTPSDGGNVELVNGCGAWSVVPSPTPPGTESSTLHDVLVLAPDDAWAVGRYTALTAGDTDQFTLTMHWDGAAWSVVPSPSPSPTLPLTWCDLYSIHGAAPDDLWAIGQKNDYDIGPVYIGPHALALHWDGSAWSEADIPLPGGGSSTHQQASGDEIRDIVAIAPDDVWFVGDWFAFLPSDAVIRPALAMHWDGSSFEVIEDPFFDQYDEALNAVAAAASDDVWAVGSRSQPIAEGVIYHYDGAGWSQVSIPVPPLQLSALSDVVVVAANDVWASGTSWDPFPGEAVPWFLHWDGASWSAVTSPAGGASLTVVASDDVYSWGLGGLAHWNGATWTAEPPLEGVPGAGFGALASFDACSLWAVGGQSVAGSQMSLTAQITPAEALPDPVAGDASGDGLVDVNDLTAVITAWGPCPGCPEDLDGDGTVGVNDLVLVILNWS